VDGLQALPVRDRDPLTVRTTDAFEAEKARLLGGQLHHPVGHDGEPALSAAVRRELKITA